MIWKPYIGGFVCTAWCYETRDECDLPERKRFLKNALRDFSNILTRRCFCECKDNQNVTGKFIYFLVNLYDEDCVWNIKWKGKGRYAYFILNGMYFSFLKQILSDWYIKLTGYLGSTPANQEHFDILSGYLLLSL